MPTYIWYLVAVAIVLIIVFIYHRGMSSTAPAPAKVGVEGTTAWGPSYTLPRGPGPWSMTYGY